MKSFFRSVSVWLFIANMIFILSCGEESEDPIRLQPEGATGTLAAMKVLTQAAPAAPQMLVPAGTPTVKSVGYYSDWRLTKPVKGVVPAGKTLFIKVEFSEGMKLVVADDKTARPILYRRIAGKLTRFRIANFGAKGEDFVSGDAKPVKNQKTYLCKYTVKPEDKGVFVFAVGKFSIDRQGNKLPAFYTHTERLQIRKSLSPKTESADEEQNLADTEPPAVVSIEYYLNGNATLKVNPVTESVGAGTDIFTKITFSEPVTPVITYTTGGDETRYARAGRFGVHWRDTCKPLDATGTVFLCLSVAWEDAFSVTVSTDTVDFAENPLAEAVTSPMLSVVSETQPPVPEPEDIPVVRPVSGAEEPISVGNIPIQTGENVRPGPGSFFGTVYVPKPRLKTSSRNYAQPLSGVTVTIISGQHSGKSVVTNQSGQYLFQGIGANELHLLVKKEGFEPKEVVVHRSNPTTLPDRVRLNFRDDPQNSPGNILIGHRWPKVIRDILQNTITVPDLLCVHMPLTDRGGFYDNGVCVINTSNSPSHFINVHAHEIAHAHQDAYIQGNWSGWTESPEGRSFVVARDKDWMEIGKAPYDADSGLSTPLESAAETFAYWWSIGRWNSKWNLKRDAPNRLRWAEEWFGK